MVANIIAENKKKLVKEDGLRDTAIVIFNVGLKHPFHNIFR